MLSSDSEHDEFPNARKSLLQSNDEGTHAVELGTALMSGATPPVDTHAACAWGACANDFSSYHQLAAHLSKDHIGLDQCQTLACKWRGCALEATPMRSRYHLITHLVKHTGSRSFLCPFDACGKVYKRTDFLRRHINTHMSAAEQAESIDAERWPVACNGGTHTQKMRSRRNTVVTQADSQATGSDNDTSTAFLAKGASSMALGLATHINDAGARHQYKRKQRDIQHERSSDNNSSDDSDANHRYYDCRDANSSAAAQNGDSAVTATATGYPDLLKSESESAKLEAMLHAQLGYIASQVDVRKEKLERVKTKIRRLRMENDILLDALTHTG
ncbi:hypothetical protein BX661DRAFT_177713 [Kickxella alabastrina]|uniref:uncharacterized protein n=1 Tax=Kickxella alabastrina TaxID=61397 RepID=UPI002220D370|nr:uncharacterized protein BX661DRAFT_177713 [Kickxella alabastrina]KAI7833878.1 hypothetical protein BX661DRAFT_177713 [Kickxella alabastrina]